MLKVINLANLLFVNTHCMKTLLIGFFSIGVCASYGQSTNQRGAYYSEGIENLEMGWTEVLKFNEPAKAYVKNGWNYPANQIAFRETVISWWQSTYTPKGVMGEMIKSVLAPARSEWPKGEYRQQEDDNRFALPNTYGAFARIHSNISKTETKKFWPSSGNLSYSHWNIMANNVTLLSNQIVGLSSPDEYYFTMPMYSVSENEQVGNFAADHYVQYAGYCDFSKAANLKKYQHYLRPDTKTYIVILTKDNQPLPFEQVTVDEFLNRIEKQFSAMQSLNADSRVPGLVENARRGFQVLKEQYKNKLNEYVYFSDHNKQKIELYDFQYIEEKVKKGKPLNFIYTDAISKNNSGGTLSISTNYPLFRICKGVKELCATGGPQWIVFSLGVPVNLNYAGSKHTMNHFVHRFNYDYVYQYYFATKPSKPYQSVGND
jgi:hypothetical protein